VCCSSICWSDNSQPNLGIATIDAYKAICGYIENQEYEKVEAAVYHLNPVLNLLEKKYDVVLIREIEIALKSKDISKINYVIRKIVYYDMVSIFDNIDFSNETVDKIRVRLKLAYSDYLLISPYIIKQNRFRIDQLIKKDFRRAYNLLASEKPYSKYDLHVNTNTFNDVSDLIKLRVVEIFQDIKSPK
jgi:hypothetical protein